MIQIFKTSLGVAAIAAATVFTSGAALAEDWRFVASSHRYASGVDLDSIRHVDGILEARIVGVVLEAGGLVDYFDVRVQQNCAAKTNRILDASMVTLARGVIDRRPTPDADWEPLEAGSPAEAEALAICTGQAPEPGSADLASFVAYVRKAAVAGD